MSITGTNNPFPCDPVVFANANAIISLGTITRVGNVFTFSVGFVWKISGVTYQNTAPVELTIAEATEGFNRIDNALLNTANTIELQQGAESDTIALQPTFPDNTILLTTWNVSGDTIGDIVPAESDAAKEDKVSGVIATGTNDYSASGSDLYALVAELKILVTFTNPNTTASTFNYNGLGAFPIVKNYDDAVASGDVKGTMWLRFNGTKWVIVGAVGSTGVGSQTTILVQEASQIVNQELDSNKVYVLEGQITLGSGETIIVPATGLTLIGYGFNVSSIFTSVAGLNIFTSPIGGSGDLILDKFSITNTGVGSQVFDIVDSTGEHAIEIEYVNFSGCKSLGKIDGYRQGTVTTAGLYGCADGLQLSGAWNGFKVTNTNIFGFGNTGTFIKKDVDTTFTNRLFLSLNLDFPVGAKLTDFESANFLSNELLQINSSIVKVAGVINSDVASTIIPNLSANNTKCLWIGNIGLPDTAIENFVENTNVTGAYNIDWLKDTYLLTMTGNTTFTESNLPASGKNTQEIKIYLQGNFIPTFPANWLTNAVGTYKATDLNEITLKFIKTGVYFMKIDNSLSVYPKPSLQSLVPTSLLPSTTASLTINGSFFTPETIVSIENQTVNSIEFINQGQLILSVTTSAVEEEVDITISNGTTVIFSGVLPINLGVVFIPAEADWISLTGSRNISESGKMKLVGADITGSAIFDQIVDISKDWIVTATAKRSVFKPTGGGGYLELIDSVTGTMKVLFDTDSAGYNGYLYDSTGYIGGFGGPPYNFDEPLKHEYRYIDGILRLYKSGVLRYTWASLPFSSNLKIKMTVVNQDWEEIKYIELP